MNYKKIYLMAIKTVLGGRKGVVLRQFTESAAGHVNCSQSEGGKKWMTDHLV